MLSILTLQLTLRLVHTRDKNMRFLRKSPIFLKKTACFSKKSRVFFSRVDEALTTIGLIKNNNFLMSETQIRMSALRLG